MSKFKIAMAVMALVMAFSLTSAAFAQGPQPPATPTPTPSPKSEYNQTFWQILAQKLGVTVDKLQQAIRDALKETVGKMLSDGKLTREQADKAQSRIDQLTFDRGLFGPFRGGRDLGKWGARFAFGQAELDAAAAKLGMTTQDLMAELRQGKSLSKVAKEKNVNPDDLKAAIVAAVTAQLDQAVKDGKLTQAQADQIKAQVEKLDLDQAFGKGGFKGGWHFGGRGKPFPKSTPQPSTP